MASRTIQNTSSSRIPVVVKGQVVPPVSNIYVKEIKTGSAVPKENERGKSSTILSRGDTMGQKGHEASLTTIQVDMTGCTNNSVKTSNLPTPTSNSKSNIPRLGSGVQKPKSQRVTENIKPQQSNTPSPRLGRSQIPGLIKNQGKPPSSPKQQKQSSSSSTPSLSQHNHNMNATPTTAPVSDFGFVHAPLAETEDFSDLSRSSCSEGGDVCLENGHNLCPNPPEPDRLPNDSKQLDDAMETLNKMQWTLPGNSGCKDSSISEPPSSGDSGCIHDGQTSDTDTHTNTYSSSSTADKTFVNNLGNALSDIEKECDSNETVTINRNGDKSCSDDSVEDSSTPASQSDDSENIMSSCKSGETFHMHATGADHHLVRTSKSHENYLQGGASLALVNIDLDDSRAYSLDTLTYHDSSNSSLDNVNSEAAHMSKSLTNSPEKLPADSLERDLLHPAGIVSTGNPLPKDGSPRITSANNNSCVNSDVYHPPEDNESLNASDISSISSEEERVSDISDANEYSLHLGPLTDDSDAESLYHQPSKAVDRPSAERLAKRLFHLEGFKKSDVSRHLCKKNDFSNLVAEEYLKFFDYQEDTLDLALRKFLTYFSLNGETQERERVLQHFSRRFMECNHGSFNSDDACHTLTCAIMLLNSDLHAPNVGRRMTCQEFIENLAELNEGDNFSKEVLRAIYMAIKNEPIEWAVDDCIPEGDMYQDQQLSTPPASPKVLDSNPFLDVPDPSKTTEYKCGYVMRKCCMDANRRKTAFAKRGWKKMYIVLRDMILYQYKGEHQMKKGGSLDNPHNVVRIHHALATKATDYTKKQHVMRLQTADWAEYLFQTGNSQEVQEWIDTINFVAASLSAPPLPGAVGSKAKFQRPLLPSSYTRLNLREQLFHHENREKELEQELQIHRARAPEKGSKSSVIQEYLDKEIYLEFEIKRFKTYVYLLKGKLTSFPDLEPSLVETTIGEYEEMGATQSPLLLAPDGGAMPGQGGSLSDRYSYRAAIFQNETNDYDTF